MGTPKEKLPLSLRSEIIVSEKMSADDLIQRLKGARLSKKDILTAVERNIKKIKTQEDINTLFDYFYNDKTETWNTLCKPSGTTIYRESGPGKTHGEIIESLRKQQDFLLQHSAAQLNITKNDFVAIESWLKQAKQGERTAGYYCAGLKRFGEGYIEPFRKIAEKIGYSQQVIDRGQKRFREFVASLRADSNLNINIRWDLFVEMERFVKKSRIYYSPSCSHPVCFEYSGFDADNLKLFIASLLLPPVQSRKMKDGSFGVSVMAFEMLYRMFSSLQQNNKAQHIYQQLCAQSLTVRSSSSSSTNSSQSSSVSSTVSSSSTYNCSFLNHDYQTTTIPAPLSLQPTPQAKIINTESSGSTLTCEDDSQRETLKTI